MKTIKLNLMAMLVFFSSVSQAFTVLPGFEIMGQINGLEEGTTVELVPGATYKDEKPTAIAKVQNGKFRFSGKVDGPRYFLIMVQGAVAGRMMVENSIISIRGNATLNDVNGSKRYLFNDVKVTGSPVNEVLLQKMEFRERLNQEHTDYNKRGAEIAGQVRVARAAKNTKRLDSLVKTEAYQAFENDEKEFFIKVKKLMNNLFVENGDTWWGPFLMLNTLSYITPEQRPTFDGMSVAAKNSYYGQILKEEIYPKGFLGEAAPAVDAKTNANAKAEISQIFKNNKYTIIDFWASWCAPCRKALPGLKSFYQDVHAKGVEIVSISIDKSESDWVKAEQEEQLKWPSYLDVAGTSANAWKVRAIPAMFLIDQNGKVIAENLTMQELKERLKTL